MCLKTQGIVKAAMPPGLWGKAGVSDPGSASGPGALLIEERRLIEIVEVPPLRESGSPPEDPESLKPE